MVDSVGGPSFGGFSFMPDIGGALSVNANIGRAALSLAESQAATSGQMVSANNVNTVASAWRDMSFGINKQLRDASSCMFA